MGTRHRVYSRRPHLWRRPPNGAFYIIWQDGTQTRKLSTKTRKRAVAEAALDAFLEDFDRSRVCRRPITLHEGIQEWLADRLRPRHELAACTRKLYSRWSKMFITFFPASLHVNDVTPAVVRRFLDWREDQGISPSSLKKDLGCLSMVFRFLVREGLARGNPCDAVTVRAKAKRNPAMTESEFVELRSTISKELSSASNPEERRTAQDLLDLVDVLWHSGLRFVESVRVTWEDIDLSSANWTIRSPYNKGGTQTIPLHHDVLPILKRRKLLATPGPFAGYWHFSNLWRDFKHRNAAFRGWGFHRMRHAFVTRLRKNGFDAAAMALARHKTVAMSVHYTHLEPSDFREHLDAL